MRQPIRDRGAALLFACTVLAFSTAPRIYAADNDPMSVYYENTLTCQGGADDNWLCYDWYYPGGYVREMQVIRRRDGFIALHGREGTFKLTTAPGGQPRVCQTLDGGAHTWCRQLSSHSVGDRWEETLANGQKQTFSILRGRDLSFSSGLENDTHVLAPYHYPDYPPDPNRAIKDVGGAASG